MKLTDKLENIYFKEAQKNNEVLNESEERCRLVVEHSNDGIALVKGDEFLYVNQKFLEIFGYEQREEVIGRSATITVHPDDREMVITVNRQRQAGEPAPSRYEFKGIRRDGAPVYIEVSAVMVPYYGEPVSLAYLRDITERKKAEETLQEEKEKLLAIINVTSDKIFLIDIDGVILAINNAAAVYLGLDPDRAVGANIFDNLTPQDAKKRRARLQKIFLTQQSFQIESKHQDEWVDTCFYPIIVDGKVVRIVVYGRDITGRKLAEEALKNNEKRYRSIFENAMEGIFQSSIDGRFIRVNHAMASLYGYESPEDMIENITDIPHQLYANYNEYEQNRKLVEEHGIVRNFEHEAIRKDGSKIWVSTNTRIVFDARGCILYYEGTVVADITSRKKAEETLKEEWEKHQIALNNAHAIINATTDAIYLFDIKGVLLTINEAGAARLGIDFSTAIGTNVYEDVPPEVEQRRRSRVGEVISTKKPMYYEADKRGRWFDTCLFPVITDEIVTGIALYGRDITERKLVEEALKKSEERFRIILENAPVGMAMIGKDNAFKYLNPKFKELFSYDVEDIPNGRTWFRKAFPDPEYRHALISTWLSRDKGSNGRILREIPKTFNTTCKDGTIKAVNFLTVTLETGDHIMTCEDVTELIKTEERLFVERYRFKSLTESAPFGMVLIDNSGAFKYLNPKFIDLFGYDADDIPDGRTWFRKAFPDSNYRHMVVSAWVEDMESIRNKAPTKQWIFDVRCKDGTFKIIRFVPVQLKESEYVMTCEDITENKKAEEELRKHHEHLAELVEERTLELKAANKELEAFSYSVSHDLRTPLRAIDGFSRILSDDHASQLSQEAQRYLRLVREGAQQMGKLIEDLLVFSRLSRQPITKQTVAPADIVRQMLDQLRHMQAGRHVEISIGELPVCQSDPSLLKVVYMNLISNALKFTGKRDCALIEIGCRNENGERVYYVKDNGAGFNMKYAGKLFGVFQRLHKAEDFEGTGVGLASVQRVIHRHGGRIWVVSELDKGTTFYFTLEKGGKLS
jgi:PAS domain S-box-containing protein